jgi:hypothetical protein
MFGDDRRAFEFFVQLTGSVIENPHGLHWKRFKFSANARRIMWSSEALKGLKSEKARDAIVKTLKESGLVYKQEPTNEVIPVAERSGAPLEIIVTAQWFIKTLDFKAEILGKGREILWHPDYMRQRFESWVEGLKWDWAISRQRHFDVAFPVWYSKRSGEEGRILVAAPESLPVDPTIDTLSKSRLQEHLKRTIDAVDAGFSVASQARGDGIGSHPDMPPALSIGRPWPVAEVTSRVHDTDRFRAAIAQPRKGHPSRACCVLRYWFPAATSVRTLSREWPFSNTCHSFPADDGLRTKKWGVISG